MGRRKINQNPVEKTPVQRKSSVKVLSTNPLDRKPIPQEISNEDKNKVVKIIQEIESDSVFAQIKTQIKGTGKAAKASVNVEGDDPRAKAIAENCLALWKANIGYFLDAFAYGRSAFEKVWGDYDPTNNLKLYKKLVYLSFQKSSMKLDEDNHFGGIEYKQKDYETCLPPENCFWLSIDPDPEHPFGKSRYEGAPYKVYQDRKILLLLEAEWNRRLAVSPTIVRAPNEMPIENARSGSQGNTDLNGELIDPIEDTVNKIAEALSGGIVGMSSKSDDKGKYLFSIEQTSQQNANTPLIEALKYTETRAYQSVGFNPNAYTASGTYGSIKEASKITEIVANDILDQIKSSFQRYVIDPLVDANEWEVKPKITISSVPLGSGDASFVTSMIPMFSNGLTSDLVRLINVRAWFEQFSVPVAEDFDEEWTKLKNKPSVPAAPANPSFALKKKRLASYGGNVQKHVLDQIAEETKERSAQIWLSIRKLLRNRKFDPHKLDDYLAQLQDIRRQAILGGQVYGIAIPQMKRKKLLASTPTTFIWQNVADAIVWLHKQDLILPKDVESLLNESGKQAAAASASYDHFIKEQLEKSINEGMGHKEWQDHISQFCDFTEAEAELVQRTYSKRGMLQSTTDTLQDPAMKAAFPYAKYDATDDTRTRQTHKDMDDHIFPVDSPEYTKAVELQGEWNCRCSLNLLSEEDARAEGYVGS
jgi:hypothetical protein